MGSNFNHRRKGLNDANSLLALLVNILPTAYFVASVQVKRNFQEPQELSSVAAPPGSDPRAAVTQESSCSSWTLASLVQLAWHSWPDEQRSMLAAQVVTVLCCQSQQLSLMSPACSRSTNDGHR